MDRDRADDYRGGTRDHRVAGRRSGTRLGPRHRRPVRAARCAHRSVDLMVGGAEQLVDRGWSHPVLSGGIRRWGSPRAATARPLGRGRGWARGAGHSPERLRPSGQGVPRRVRRERPVRPAPGAVPVLECDWADRCARAGAVPVGRSAARADPRNAGIGRPRGVGPGHGGSSLLLAGSATRRSVRARVLVYDRTAAAAWSARVDPRLDRRRRIDDLRAGDSILDARSDRA